MEAVFLRRSKAGINKSGIDKPKLLLMIRLARVASLGQARMGALLFFILILTTVEFSKTGIK
jgi:hypothetical protein